MSVIKEIIIDKKCSLCGLCEQEELKEVFDVDKSGNLIALNSGMVDVERYPKITEVEKMCPVSALQLKEVEVAVDKGEALQQFNQLVNKELRDFPFDPPSYYDYDYEINVYHALPVPAQYKSKSTYFSDDAAQDAGLRAFDREVYSQYKSIVRQYVAAYKVKRLKQYYTYEEVEDNYYYHINSEISKRLNKAVQLAQIVSDGKADIPDDFDRFEIRPQFQKIESSWKKLKDLETYDIDLSHSGDFHTLDYYRFYIDTDEGEELKSITYDFTSVEESFRDDLDFAINDAMEAFIVNDVTCVTNEFLKTARQELFRRLKLLQAEMKKCGALGEQDLFASSISDYCDKIGSNALPGIPAPRMKDFDDRYNSDHRFRSEGACEDAAINRRERAYKEGERFVNNLPQLINDAFMERLAELFTEWKRGLLGIYDANGHNYPNRPLKIQIGKTCYELALSGYDNAEQPQDTTIYDYVKRNYSPYTVINGEKYISEFDVDYETDRTWDDKETLFGGWKEVNVRYAYYINLNKFERSANAVSKAWVGELSQTDFLREYILGIRNSFIKEIQSITGVSNNMTCGEFVGV